MIDKKYFEENNLELIPIEEVDITFDPDMTIGYDLTVEDYFTFSSHDGVFVQDTMAIFHPLSNESQQEVKDKMMNGIGATESTSVTFSLSNEMFTGLYFLTKPFPISKAPVLITQRDIDEATNPMIPVKYKNVTTTLGRAILNNCFPPDFPFQDIQATKKTINKILLDIQQKYDISVAKECANKLKNQGFKWATIGGSSITIDILDLPPEVMKIKEQIKSSTPDEAELLIKQATKMIEKHLEDTGLGDMVFSGGSKGMSQMMQILVAKGIIADAEGNVLAPISSSFSEGLSNKEYFQMAPASRKGIVDRVINTADTGYMSRKLAFVMNPVEADPYKMDCGTKRTLTVKLTGNLKERLAGRYVVKDGKVIEFNPNDYKVGEVIELRSPIFCKSQKLCFYCYGKLLRRHRTPYVGILAAQAIGERGTQMIMKSFHTGGAVELIRRDMIQDIIDGDPLANLEK